MTNKRDTALDVMRGIAILFMVEIHFLIHVRPIDSGVYTFMRSIGALAAPFFLICAGMGIGYMQRRYQASQSDLRGVLLRRGLFLIVFTSVLGLYHLDITRAVDWDIFTVIGTMYVVVALAGGIRLEVTLPAILLVLFANQFLPIDSPAILRGGSFPIIPFAAYFLFGVLFAQIRQLPREKSVTWIAILLASAIMLILVFGIDADIFGLTRYDVWSLGGIVGVSALFFLFLNLIRSLQTWPQLHRVEIPLTRLGGVSFSLYYIQFFLLIIIPRMLQTVLHQEILILIPSVIWFGFLFLLFGFLYAIVLVWGRFGYKYGLEWFMNKYISRRSMFPAQNLKRDANA